MGIDISHIVRHDFYDLDDLNKSRAFCEKVRNQLWSNLLLDSCIDDEMDGPDLYLDEEFGFELRIPYQDIELDLRPGCWDIESFYHYIQLVMGNYVRDLVFDIVHALGQEEVWHTTEKYTWNGGPLDDPKCSFQQWYDFIKDKYGENIPEFNSHCINQYDKDDYLIYENVYHDNFEEPIAEFNRLQNKTDKYRLIGLTRVGKNMLRAEKDGELYLLHDFNMRPVLPFPVKTEYTFRTWIVVWKENKSAVFDAAGNQLTPFVNGRFEIAEEKREIQRNGEKYNRHLIFAENREAKIKVVLQERIF